MMLVEWNTFPDDSIFLLFPPLSTAPAKGRKEGPQSIQSLEQGSGSVKEGTGGAAKGQ